MSEFVMFLHCNILPQVRQCNPKAGLPHSLFLKLSFRTNPSAPTAQLKLFKNESFEHFPEEY